MINALFWLFQTAKNHWLKQTEQIFTCEQFVGISTKKGMKNNAFVSILKIYTKGSNPRLEPKTLGKTKW